MALLKYTLFLSLVASALAGIAQNCTSAAINCPATGSFNVCASDSLKGNILLTCVNGCPQPGNCNDNLAGVPPVGIKSGASCYQDSPTAGNAQCTFNCVSVVKHDGTTFYPLGCTSSSPTSGPTSTTTSASVSGSGGSSPNTSLNPTGTGTSGGSGGHGGGVVSSTTYFTTTLPGGQVSTGSSVIVAATGTSTPSTLSNDGNGLKAEWLVMLLVGELIALF